MTLINKSALSVLLAASPAMAGEFDLNRAGTPDLRDIQVAVAPQPAPVLSREKGAFRLSVGEIENRWIAAIFVAGRNLGSIAASAQGVSPHAAPAGYAVSLSILADRTAAAAETMHYAHLDGRWHIVANEANRLDRVAADVREWAAEAKAHHNAAALRAGDLARAGEDLASALRWLRADAGLKTVPQPAVMPAIPIALTCSSPDKAVNLEGWISRKGGELRVASPGLYGQYGGEGETLRFVPEPGSAKEAAAFVSNGGAFFDYTLELPSGALGGYGEHKGELLVSFNDETSRRFALDCVTGGAGGPKYALNSRGLDGLDSGLCPNAEHPSADAAVCGVKGAEELFRTTFRRADRVEKLPFSAYGIVDLGLWPDDSTDLAYSYNYALFSPAGLKIGYASLEGYVNTEMDARVKLLAKYTLKGRLASVELLPWD